MIIMLIGMLTVGGMVTENSDLKTVELYRAALNSHDIETAMSYLAEDFKLHFVGTEFVASKSDIPQMLGWDTGANSRVEWKVVDGDAELLTFYGREMNDFFELLGIAHLRFRSTFKLNAKGTIIEQQYETLSGQPSWEDAIKPAIEWASQHRPAELQEIYRNDQITFTEEMARRWVALLREWKSSEPE